MDLAEISINDNLAGEVGEDILAAGLTHGLSFMVVQFQETFDGVTQLLDVATMVDETRLAILNRLLASRIVRRDKRSSGRGALQQDVAHAFTVGGWMNGSVRLGDKWPYVLLTAMITDNTISLHFFERIRIMAFRRLDKAEKVEDCARMLCLDGFSGFQIVIDSFVMEDTTDIVEDDRLAAVTVAAVRIRLKRIARCVNP